MISFVVLFFYGLWLFYGHIVLQQRTINQYQDKAPMLTLWKYHRAAIVRADSDELLYLTHLYIWFAHSLPVSNAENRQPQTEVSLRASLNNSFCCWLFLRVLSLTKTCHHFPADAVLIRGDCCCVTWRSLRPFTDGAAPAPCLWMWQGRREERGGRGEGVRAYAHSPALHLHLKLWEPNERIFYICIAIFMVH